MCRRAACRSDNHQTDRACSKPAPDAVRVFISNSRAGFVFYDDFHPVGQGNGIPDIIDEAEWGTAIFEILQEENGGVRSGTERTGYPDDSVGLDKDTDQYAAFRVSDNSSTLAAGLFAHLARLLEPYNNERSAELQKRAEKAWAFAGDSAIIGHKFYYLIQY